MIRPVILALVPALLAFVAQPASVRAGEVLDRPGAVLELFTSQACASCPQADALLAELGAHRDIVALAYHVDYWDFTGWKDTYGSPEHSELQRAYAGRLGKNMIYTPQLAVNGNSLHVGSRRAEIEATLASEPALPVPVGLVEAGRTLEITIPPARPGEGLEGVVWLVTFRAADEVEVGAGENGGRRLPYSHIVTGRQILCLWDRVEGTRLKLPLADVLGDNSDGLAVLVQADSPGAPGPVLGAAAFWR